MERLKRPEIEKKHSQCYNPDGDKLMIYPLHTELRQESQINPWEVLEEFQTDAIHNKRIEAIHMEYLSNEIIPSKVDDIEYLEATIRVESRLYIQPPISPSSPESVRGLITCVSPKSAMRLKKLLSRAIGLSVWIDLTFADDVFEKSGELVPFNDRMKIAYNALNQFERVIRSAGVHYVWKKEIQTRKSGEYKGARIPHYHVCLCGLSPDQLAKWESFCITLLTRWVEITGTKNPKAIEVALKLKKGVAQSYRLIADTKMAVRYIGKYFSKTDAVEGRSPGSGQESIGRAWGYSRGLPLAPPEIIHLLPSQACIFRRWMRRLLCLKKNKKFIGLREQLERGYSTFAFVSCGTVKRFCEYIIGSTNLSPDLGRVPF